MKTRKLKEKKGRREDKGKFKEGKDEDKKVYRRKKRRGKRRESKQNLVNKQGNKQNEDFPQSTCLT